MPSFYPMPLWKAKRPLGNLGDSWDQNLWLWTLNRGSVRYRFQRYALSTSVFSQAGLGFWRTSWAEIQQWLGLVGPMEEHLCPALSPSAWLQRCGPRKAHVTNQRDGLWRAQDWPSQSFLGLWWNFKAKQSFCLALKLAGPYRPGATRCHLSATWREPVEWKQSWCREVGGRVVPVVSFAPLDPSMSAETSHVDFPETQANFAPLWVKTVGVECWPFINGSVSTHTRDLDKTCSEGWCVQRMILGLLGTSGTSSYNLANRSRVKVNANCSSNCAHVYMFTSRQGQLNQNSLVAPWSPAFSLFRGPWNRPAHLLRAGFSNTSQQSQSSCECPNPGLICNPTSGTAWQRRKDMSV